MNVIKTYRITASLEPHLESDLRFIDVKALTMMNALDTAIDILNHDHKYYEIEGCNKISPTKDEIPF